MAKWRIADIVRNTCCLNNVGETAHVVRNEIPILFQPMTDLHRERASDTTHLDGVNQAMMDVIMLVEGLDLRLVG